MPRNTPQPHPRGRQGPGETEGSHRQPGKPPPVDSRFVPTSPRARQGPRESEGGGGWEPRLWGCTRAGSWALGGWVGRPLIDFCLPAVPAGGRANRAPSINRLAASLIKTFYS